MNERSAPEAPTPSGDGFGRRIDLILRHVWGWGVWTLLLGFLPGLALWALNRDKPKFKLEDAKKHEIRVELPAVEQAEAIQWALISLGCLAAGYLACAIWRRWSTGAWPGLERLQRWNWRLLPLGLLPAFSSLVVDRLERDFHLLALSLVLLLALGLGYWYYRVVDEAASRSVPWLRRAEQRRVPELLTLLTLAIYSVSMSTLAIYEHKNLATHVFDLGIYDNTFWNTLQGEWLRCSYVRGETHISAHFDPIIILLSPLYALYPRAEGILVLQSVWLALGGIPLFLHSRRVLGSGWSALVIVLLYTAAPALHGINLFDFHSVALMAPLAMWLVYAIDAGARVSYWIGLALMLLVREDMPLIALMIGAYAILMRRHRLGLVTIGVAIAYLGVINHVTQLVLPEAEEKHSYHYYYNEMIPHRKLGVMGLVLTLLSDPSAAMAVLFKPEKLLYFLKVLLPVLGLPLLAGRKLLLYLYGFAFIGLASRVYVFTVHYQYSTFLIPFLYMGLPDGLRRLTQGKWLSCFEIDRARVERTVLVAALVACVGTSAKFGALAPNESFRGGWNRLHRSFSGEAVARYERFLEFVELIPSDASVCSSTTLGPHLSNRRTAYRWPACREARFILVYNNPRGKDDKRRLKEYRQDPKHDVVKETKEWILFRRLDARERAVQGLIGDD